MSPATQTRWYKVPKAILGIVFGIGVELIGFPGSLGFMGLLSGRFVMAVAFKGLTVHACIQISIYTHTKIHVYIYKCMYICIHTHACIPTYVRISAGFWSSNYVSASFCESSLLRISAVLSAFSSEAWLRLLTFYVCRWVVVKIMVPFGLLSTVRQLVFRGPKRGP